MTSLSQSVFASALVLGLFGGAHCVAMCGGIAGALGQAAPPKSRAQAWLRAAVDSAGRITSYVLAGVIVGGIGGSFAAWTGLALPMRLLAGGLIAIVGLHVAGAWNGAAALERLGLAGWRRLAPLARRIGRPDRLSRRFLLGMLWGWLPCGLVYAALVTAAALGGAGRGATFMACFGLGTLPALLLVSGLGTELRTLLAMRSARRAAGVALVVFGVWSIAAVLAPLHAGSGPAPTPAAGSPHVHLHH